MGLQLTAFLNKYKAPITLEYITKHVETLEISCLVSQSHKIQHKKLTGS